MDEFGDGPESSLGGSQLMNPEWQSRKRIRPGAVEVLSFYQVAKAALIIPTAAFVICFPNTRWGSEWFWQAMYVASNGGGKPGYVTLLVGIYAALVGLGLWNLKKWARYCLMATSGTTAIRWIRYLALNWALGAETLDSRTPKPGFERDSLYMLIATDVFVFCYLTFYPDVTEAFESTEDNLGT